MELVFARSFIRTIIRNQLIASNTIPGSKIANGAITANVFSGSMVNYLCGLNSTQIALGGNTAPDNFIKSHKYINHYPGVASPIDHTKIVPDFQIWSGLYCAEEGSKAFNVGNIAKGAITSRCIADNSLAGDRLKYSSDGNWKNLKTPRPIGQLLADGCIGVNNIPKDWKNKLGL